MFKSLINLFYPKICYACNNVLTDNENGICTVCRHELPVTNYHLEDNNQVEKVFFGRVKIIHATSLFWFQKKGMVQQLLHNLKYRGHEEIGKILGQWLGYELKNSSKFKDIDLVIPVPLHKSRQRKRGYNQVAKFAQEIANQLDALYVDYILVKTIPTKTQVFKTRFSRWDDSKAMFNLKHSEELKGKHILLVDDIITTGATIESCANVLLNHKFNKDIKISVATMAIA
ncbi:MAG: ComF family protein [Bacteroidia bacterium]|nr:ComF family protein [Bacteroidia bacterium]